MNLVQLFDLFYYRPYLLLWLSKPKRCSITSGALGTIALIVFGALGDGRNYMPEWEHNFLSWSFALAFVGVIFQFIAGVLFIVEARIMFRWQAATEKPHPMEQRV